jgi:alpha/beta superfamily hydrolase
MKERKVLFKSGHFTLEGLYSPSEGSSGAIITHPHPLMGGDMWNNIVELLVSALYSHGCSTLRFNFRGVGLSEGVYDNGNGEQEDVISARIFMEENEKTNLILAGYSFGAVVDLNVFARDDSFNQLILVSPPTNMYSIAFSKILGRKILAICGDRDEFCSLRNIGNNPDEALLSLITVEGANHFYAGREDVLANQLSNYLSNVHV